MDHQPHRGPEVGPLLDAALVRLEWLRRESDAVRDTLPPTAVHVFDEALEELGSALEELQVTLENLSESSQQLAESERRYEDLFHVTADGLFVTDASGVIKEVNAEAASMLGATPEQLTGKPLVVLVAGPDRRHLHTSLSALRDGAGRVRLDVTVQPRQGEPFPGSLHARAEDTGGTAPPAAVRWALRDDSDRAAMQERLVFHARHDLLTGVLNRSHFLESLQEAIDLAGDAAGDVAVLFIDLDRFKAVNDRLGHQAGDRLLTAVATRIRQAVRDADLIGRLGGDEFAVACHVTDSIAEAVQLARRVRDSLLEPFTLGAAQASIGATIGVAAGVTGGGAEELLRHADQAMYTAKRAGGGRIQVFTEALEDAVALQVRTEAGLRSALRSGHLSLRYQPQVALDDGRLLAVEALVRWQQEPGASPLPAASFVGIAEECGLLAAIDSWVVEQACRDAVAWRALPGSEDLTVGVNISSVDLADPGFETRVLGALQASGLAPSALCLEVTERSALDTSGLAEGVLRRMHDHGIRIAIDDFGTGFSALSYLRQLPIDLVKIDKSFVERLPTMREDRLIVTSVVGIADLLGFEVVAEGVENHEQIAALLSGGCRQGQGYLLSLPLEAEEVAARIEQGWHAEVA